ncbi:uncharacterized protein LAESUDRAFT_718230 [Laetiporus sulphureus 93-53]|uniref:Uncharacterized protein n=1 Tax=Laetiporus sulphureus 93-53 TaxID=1314785 RepID=A0A165B5X8_9APHY|nr:uncharacterized protein LAESUDRAFT_718230 [Laetiporus sulphureus 93-53]KZT00312.1 hypothetical protein LAESUDRAFT_718230 [Laetiporus sulphureus 93-53]
MDPEEGVREDYGTVPTVIDDDDGPARDDDDSARDDDSSVRDDDGSARDDHISAVHDDDDGSLVDDDDDSSEQDLDAPVPVRNPAANAFLRGLSTTSAPPKHWVHVFSNLEIDSEDAVDSIALLTKD